MSASIEGTAASLAEQTPQVAEIVSAKIEEGAKEVQKQVLQRAKFCVLTYSRPWPCVSTVVQSWQCSRDASTGRCRRCFADRLY